MNIRHLAVLLTLGAVPFAIQAGVYSWKGADGKTHYGDRPPAERQADSRQLQAAPPADESAQKAVGERQMAEREKQQKAQETGKKAQEDQAEEQKRKEGCQQAKANLEALESGKVRYSIDAKGERVGLEGAAREAELAKARKSFSEWCAPPKPAAKK